MTDQANENQRASEGTPLLDGIVKPADLARLSHKELRELAAELRKKIIGVASENGGHLAPHLGVVELAIALHYCLDAEQDKIIWDVGHQCYPHKLLTGRAGVFESVRKKGGIAGYPKLGESPYDAFGVGHSSTSISAALGMAMARDQRGGLERYVAVIGDGAMTAGMAFEALAHAGHLGTDLLVVLNDNEMAISRNVGALSAYFNRLITNSAYRKTRDELGGMLKHIVGPQLSKAAQRFEHGVKGMLVPGTIFEELGFRYVGPVDGHDLDALIECLNNLKGLHGPVFFHCVTKKGKGYGYAEEDPQTYHGVKAFDIETGRFRGSQGGSKSSPGTFTDAFTHALIDAAESDPRVVGITAAMATGTGLSEFEKKFPSRMYDVGICEQHAVTFSAGLAVNGLKPVCAIYSTFLQRGFDQLVHDVCLQGLPVVFAVDRAGAVGEDSPTQQGAFDLSFLRCVPGLTLVAPRDAQDTQAMLAWALQQEGPVAMRYARGAAPAIGPEARPPLPQGQVLREGNDAFFLGVGPVLAACLEAAAGLASEGLSVGVADARCVKPLDTALLDKLAGMPLVTVEENTTHGGLGSAVLEHFAQTDRLGATPVRFAGFPDAYVPHATRNEQLADLGLDAAGLRTAMQQALSRLEHHSLK